MEGKVAIETRGLVKSYGPVQALRGLDLAVRQGEILGFLGPNGAGKTTTIRCLLDLIRPQGGTVRVLGMDPHERSKDVRRQVGYVPGELNLPPNMVVMDLLRYLNELRANRADWGYVRGLAERLELDLRSMVKNLSHGNKQKVGLVQALMHRPRLLLMDEPTIGLDPLMQREVYRLLREAQGEGATVFFSSHILGEVEQLADRVAIIRRGVMVEEARPDRLIRMAMRRVHVRFNEPVDLEQLGHVAGVKLLARDDGTGATLEVEGEMGGLIKALADLPVRDLETERPSLEEVFLAYYEGEKQEVH